MPPQVQSAVLVTGGGGFIGANLCRTLLDRGAPEVTVLDDFSTGFRSNLDGLDVRLVEGSILDRDLLAATIPPGGAIVHLAARPSVPRSVIDPVTSHELNATGTLYVLEAARAAGASQVIVASSSSVYGDNDAPVKHEELPASPRSPYAVSKLATESYALSYQRTYGLPTLAFRFFNVYGPLQAAGHAYAAVIPAFIDAALSNRPLIVHGDGQQSRDFTFVDSVTDVISRAIAQQTVFDGPVNLAFGSSASLLEIIALLEVEFGRPLEREFIEPRSGDVLRSRASSDRLHSLVPDASATEIATGIARTVAWLRSESIGAGDSPD